MISIISFPFMQNAVIGAILISILCGIVGSYIVITRKILISGSISHASFGGVGLAFLFSIPPLFGAACFSIIVAIIIQWISKHLKMREDSAIGMIWACGMAIGVIAIYLAPGYSKDLSSYLFGDILSLSYSDIFFVGTMVVVVSIIFYRFYALILFSAFDENYIKTRGIPSYFLDYLLMIIISLSIIASLRLIGIILIVAMLTIPQECASIFVKKFNQLILFSIIFSLISTLTGLFLAFFLNVPPGPIIILFLTLIYAIMKISVIIVTFIKKKRASH